jgi:hypothetical protein
MAHDTEQSHQLSSIEPLKGDEPPVEEMLDDESEDFEPGIKRLSFIDRISRKQKIGLVAGILVGVTALGFGGTKLIEASNNTAPDASPDIPTAGASVVPGSTEQPSASASSSETKVESPNDPIGSKNDMTVFESSEVSQMYSDVASNSIFKALIECSQSEIDTIRQVLKGYEDPALMTQILVKHGVQTTDWIPDSPTPSKS